MGGKNRAKKLAPAGGGSTTKKSASVKVKNKTSNKAARARNLKETESRGVSVEAKNARHASNKSERAAARKNEAAEGGGGAEARKKKRSHGSKGATGPSVQQRMQHKHEPRAMRQYDESDNARAQAKADKRAGKVTAAESAAAAAAAEEEPEANAADERFFARNEQLAGFLENLNADDLSWSKEDKQKPKPRFPAQQPGAKKRAAASSDEDDSEDDSEGSDESDSEDDGPVKKKMRGEGGEAKFERGPRKPSWETPGAAKERMKVRNADGSWGISEVTKADAAAVLRARAAKLEQAQRRKDGLEPEEDAEAGDDAQMVDADASASEGEGSQSGSDNDDDDEQDEDEYFDDEIPGDDDEDLEAELEMEDAAEAALAQAEQLPADKIKEMQERRQHRLKLELAENSELILENPDKNIGKLEPMLQQCTDGDLVVQQYALMSCVEVLVDLMPTYRIRMPTDEEMAANLSKEVKATWKYERSYLLYYGRLVTTLLTYLRHQFPPKLNDRIAVSALQMNLLRCACKLLEKGYHFNYRKELLNALTPFLNHVSPRIRLLIFQTLVATFRADIAGESTLEIVRVLSAIIKAKGRRVQTEVMQVFLYLPLHKEILEAQVEEKKKAVAKKKGNSYVKVDDKALNKDLAESEATVSLATRKKIQTQLLTELFTSYFRVLKQQRNAKILPVVLRGLSKFATLIDIELVLDLLDCLKATIRPDAEAPLSLDSTLYCILTSFQTLQSHGQALAMDLKEFYNCLYEMLFRFADPAEVQHIPLLLQCLHLMFHETKQLSIERVASFVQRLCSLALYVPPYASLALMHAVRLCLNKYPRVKQLLDREATASGLHLAEIDDPDLANSFAATLWELGLLKASYHPFVPVYASSVLEDQPLPLALQRTTPVQLFENYDTSAGGFNPPLPLPMLFTSGGGGGGAGSAPTSASMKKKLDLKRRIMLHQLSAAHRDERLQSPFLRNLMQDSRKRKRDDVSGGAHARLQAKLDALKTISDKLKQHKQQQQQKQKQRKAKPVANGKAASHKAKAAAPAGSSSQKKQR